MNGLFNVNGGELVVILLVLALVVGPDRLPEYAEQLARFVRGARDYARQARQRVDDEVGEGFGDVDWASLDPRRYDPRRIVRDALLDPDEGVGAPWGASSSSRPGPGVARVGHRRAPTAGEPDAATPFDDEAT